jgi:dihydrofolate reductase
MKFFKETTTGHCIITGRKNYDSIPPKFRPLPNRTNIVMTRNSAYAEPEVLVANSLENALDLARKQNETEVFIIGGGQIYKEALEKNLVDCMYITHVQATFNDADTFFAELNTNSWKSDSVTTFTKDERHPFSFEIKKYTKKV